MEEFLTQMMGKKVDVSCGTGASVRGEVVNVKDGILFLRDEEKVAYVAVEKIAVVWEVTEHEVRTGFVTGKLK
jgi:hypothetical protein